MSDLNRLKKEIDLRAFAMAYGFAVDKKRCSKNSASFKMKDSSGNKIIVAVAAETKDHIYFSLTNPTDNGTIVDFLHHRGVRSWREKWDALRAFTGRPFPPEIAYYGKLKPSSKDVRDAVREYGEAKYVTASPYLVGRGLPPELTNSYRFQKCFKIGDMQNVLFPHYNEDGLCGFEKKNKGFTGFSSGGIKGLWSSICFKEDRMAVITESAIDAMSYQALNPEITGARYHSIGGTMSPDQLKLLSLVMQKSKEREIRLALDNDEEGEKIAAQVKEIAPKGVRITRPLPKSKDWNQDLQNKLGLS